MWGVNSAVALIVFVIFTECQSAQSERGRQRSAPFRNVPVGADVKRDTDFDCPEEFGYYPHPTDCSLYYVCVFGGALLESCTGGLMYSHELQTCDWPRNVGCEATSAAGGDELERISEREPQARQTPAPAPRRTPPPPPPPRVQPNPVVTSRGQPKVTREEYEKQQQQLFEDIDDLPPVEEFENDRQQRVYRGQPSTIGQVQRDRDGYTQLNSGRNLNSNIIPASIPQTSGKVGSFSFGTQVDDRRQTVTATQAPQTYSADINVNVTDANNDRNDDFDNNHIDSYSKHKSLSRKKREVDDGPKVSDSKNNTSAEIASDRHDEDIEDYYDSGSDEEEDIDKEAEDKDDRGKRQIRHGRYYKTAGKTWLAKPFKGVEIPSYNFNIPNNFQNIRHLSPQNSLGHNSFQDGTRKPYFDDVIYTTANPFVTYHADPNQSQKPFKASLSDPFYQRGPASNSNQIITKSPPISALGNQENSYGTFAVGGFFNNNPKQVQRHNQNDPKNHYQDSSHVSSTLVTGKPSFHTQRPVRYRISPDHNRNQQSSQTTLDNPEHSYQVEEENSSAESDSEDDDSAQEDSKFPDPPHEFMHPHFKFKDTVNPFASPNFDFDAFLAKISGNYFAEIKTTPKPNQIEDVTPRNTNPQLHFSTSNYKGMSTPRPFSVPTDDSISWSVQDNESADAATQKPVKYEQFVQKANIQNQRNQQQQASLNQQRYAQRHPLNNAGVPLDAFRPKLKPPNFNDESQLPIANNFNPAVQVSNRPHLSNSQYKGHNQFTQNPYNIFLTGTGSPIIVSTPKNLYFLKPENNIANLPVVNRPTPQNAYFSFKPSTPKPLTTVANEHLSLLQQFWKNQTEYLTTPRSIAHTDIPDIETLFSIKPISTTPPTGSKQNIVSSHSLNNAITTTMKPVPKRKIPKPSPEMNDYYYDDDELYYYEPAVKPKYMPSSEVRPQRPPMAQNYQEYDDSESYEDDSSEKNKPPTTRRPNNLSNHKTETATKNINDVSVATKAPYKNIIKNNEKIPVLVDYSPPVSTIHMRPEVSNYQIIHHQPNNNRTVHVKRPVPPTNGPNTIRPPKYLNQTTLRPYTVRHRLAKPTTVGTSANVTPSLETKQPTKARTRHPNLVTQTRATTPRDNHNQETRYTKTRHDGRTNSLEPTESVTPETYSASPKPKMLYNGSQAYSPDQFDPYYAVYDEDGELYKDSDYVQQYNLASLRPAVQQTYRGTPPPPSRRPVETYTPRPVTPEDYDDALIRGQQINQNQYQTAVRQSTRGEGNELGYDIPSSVMTTLNEVTTISTTPSTTSSTSTTTTTQRPTVAPSTEAMTPRYTQRSSTDVTPGHNVDLPSSISPLKSLPKPNSPSIPSDVNISELAKPFEKTDNLLRHRDAFPSPERQTLKTIEQITQNDPIDEVPKDATKPVSLTSGFSIRRNINNTNNPYTLTVITKPFDTKILQKPEIRKTIRLRPKHDSYDKNLGHKNDLVTENKSQRRYDTSSEIITADEPIYVRPTARLKIVEPKFYEEEPETTTSTARYFLKTVIKRPVPFSLNSEPKVSTESNIDTEAIIEKAFHNAKVNSYDHLDDSRSGKGKAKKEWTQPTISPYESLNSLRNYYREPQQYKVDTTTSSSTTVYTTTELIPNERSTTPKSSYYSYRLLDDEEHSPVTEVFSATAKNILKALFNNLVSSKNSDDYPTTTPDPDPETENVVNIGFHKKMLKYPYEKPLKTNFKRLEIINEPEIPENFPDERDPTVYRNDMASDYTTTTYPTTMYSSTRSSTYQRTTQKPYTSKFGFNEPKSQDKNIYTTKAPEQTNSLKFYQLVTAPPSTESLKPVENYSNNNIENVLTGSKTYDNADSAIVDQNDRFKNVYSTVSSTTVRQTTPRVPEQTTGTKSLSFPTRPSRVNPAIKLAATNPDGGRRSYQSSSKCSSDNSLQENPKCNEIKYQRPSPTRGRGSAHYSTLGSEAPQQQQAPNRGTPPTRSRPTLKPSTSIVSKAAEFVDIYTYPPRRPSAVYPQPTPDKTAAKCRKDVCLLPDCNCGGKDIPGDMPVESVPQIVLLTFDDSVNDLNKGLYTDLFEKGRVNPNGCPISATFYVSHEWTDYSQVQNLYAAGHEMASHTISHSFGEQFSQKKWNREVAGQREILAAYGGVKLEDVRGMRAPFLSVGGNKMFKMLYDSNFTYDSSLPVYENRPPSWPYTLDYKLFHDCMIPPCPTKSYPGVWEVPMVMWQDLNGGRCSMGDACANPPNAEGVYKMILKNFDRHYTTNRAPFGLYYHAAWFTQPHHKEGFIMFLDFINQMNDVWIITNWQALQWVRDPTPISRLNNFQPFQCDYADRPKKCNNPKVCNLWHKSGVRYMRTCQPCPEVYPWTGKSGIRSSRVDNDIEE